jgi:hypothetical protein
VRSAVNRVGLGGAGGGVCEGAASAGPAVWSPWIRPSPVSVLRGGGGSMGVLLRGRHVDDAERVWWSSRPRALLSARRRPLQRRRGATEVCVRRLEESGGWVGLRKLVEGSACRLCGGLAFAMDPELKMLGSVSPADVLFGSRSSFMELVVIADLRSLCARGLFCSRDAASPCGFLPPTTVVGCARCGGGGCGEDGGLVFSGFFSVDKWCHLVGLYPLWFMRICTALVCISLPYEYK